ncbi:MAG: hypothetical protein WKF77_31900, partial [Planctomycetaceae bacterium]
MSVQGWLGQLRGTFFPKKNRSSQRRRRSKSSMQSNVQPLEERILLSGTPIASELRLNTTTRLPQVSDSRANQTVAGLPNGGFISVWESLGQDGSGWGVYGQSFDAGGNRAGVEFRINEKTRFNQRAPSVVVSSDGRFAVAWQSFHQDGSCVGVGARIYNADGTAATAEFLV